MDKVGNAGARLMVFRVVFFAISCKFKTFQNKKLGVGRRKKDLGGE